MTEAGTEERNGVAALERGLSILDAFKRAEAPLSLGELASLTGLYKSTILRLSASLLRFGYLQRLEDGRYRLGPAVFPFARLYQNSFNLRDVVVPALRRLAARTGESASFYVRDGGSDLCLHRVASPNPVRDEGIGEGTRFPADDSVCSQVLSGRPPLVAVGRPSRRVPGVSAVVCPVFAADRQIVGALLLSGPEVRFTDAAVAAMRAAVVDEAAGLSKSLGCDPMAFDGYA